MEYTIEVIPQSDWLCHVMINGLHVGTDSVDNCNALADELKDSKSKTKLIYDLEKEENS